MSSLYVSLASLALVLSSLCVGGCAADAGEPGTEETVAVATPEAQTAPQTLPKGRLFYVAQVTRADIVGGGGSCAGNLCTINGSQYDCTGGGNCSIISR